MARPSVRLRTHAGSREVETRLAHLPRPKLVSSRRDLHLVPLHDSVTLAQFGLDARIWTTIDYPSSQRWSLHLQAWFPTADGIYYRPRHAHEQLACCLFLARCRWHLDVRSDGELGTDRDRLLTAVVPRGIHVEFSP